MRCAGWGQADLQEDTALRNLAKLEKWGKPCQAACIRLVAEPGQHTAQVAAPCPLNRRKVAHRPGHSPACSLNVQIC